MEKKTAVEWLINEHFGGIENCTPDFRYHIKKAKEMEKEQIIDFAYVIADDLAYGVFRDKKAMEERYEEFLTFKSE